MDVKGGKRAEEGGAKGGSAGGGNSSKGQGESSSKPVQPSGVDGVMKAPGAEGFISREAFEKNPQGYFHDLHQGDKGGK